MQDSVFRVYDIRGKIGEEFIIESVYDLARSLVLYLQEKLKPEQLKIVSIAMDARIHSPAIKQELIRGFLDSGIDVIDLGLCSTPMLYFSQYTLSVQAGFMITASHNPTNYNGIKMVMNKENLFDQDIRNIRDYFKNKFYAPLVSRKYQGNLVNKSEELKNSYILYLKTLFPDLVGINKKIVFDCGNGAVSAVLQELVVVFEWEQAILICSNLKDFSCNHDANPADQISMMHLKKIVLETHAELGIGFDGDGDRMGCVSHEGSWISGDKLVGIFASSIVQKNKGASIVYDATCSSLVADMVYAAGGKSYRTRSGHAFIKRAMKQYSALFGGELSSHFFFNDRYFGFDDGLYAALRLIELIIQSDKNLVQLLVHVPYKIGSQQIRLGCEIGKGPQIVLHVYAYFLKKYAGMSEVTIDTLDGVRLETRDGWCLIRFSNTEPVICIRIEGNSYNGISILREEVIKALFPYYDAVVLYKKITW